MDSRGAELWCMAGELVMMYSNTDIAVVADKELEVVPDSVVFVHLKLGEAIQHFGYDFHSIPVQSFVGWFDCSNLQSLNC